MLWFKFLLKITILIFGTAKCVDTLTPPAPRDVPIHIPHIYTLCYVTDRKYILPWPQRLCPRRHLCSEDSKSVMYPTYKHKLSKIPKQDILSDEDIQRIRHAYGRPQTKKLR